MPLLRSVSISAAQALRNLRQWMDHRRNCGEEQVPDDVLQDLLFQLYNCFLLVFIFIFNGLAFCIDGYFHALIHDSVLHRKIVLCAIECFMEIKVWPIKHSVRLCSIKHSNYL